MLASPADQELIRFKPALISKGLRLHRRVVITDHGLQASPDFKGIKTFASIMSISCVWLQASPDFKGIKTRHIFGFRLQFLRFKPALISKGLRRSSMIVSPNWVCFKPALISKGLRPGNSAKYAAAACFKPALISKGLRPRPTPRGWACAASSQP